MEYRGIPGISELEGKNDNTPVSPACQPITSTAKGLICIASAMVVRHPLLGDSAIESKWIVSPSSGCQWEPAARYCQWSRNSNLFHHKARGADNDQ